MQTTTSVNALAIFARNSLIFDLETLRDVADYVRRGDLVFGTSGLINGLGVIGFL